MKVLYQVITIEVMKITAVKPVKVLHSKIDRSVNWITPYGKGTVETRYVRKKPDYFIAYVSSHSGCRMACKFCYLTQQKQTTFDYVTPESYQGQFKTVLQHYVNEVSTDNDSIAERVNVNFMARGEALANKWIVNNYSDVYHLLNNEALECGLRMKMNISTIMPNTIRDRRLSDIFMGLPAHVYYSMYSLDPVFRREWMPNAMPTELALDKLKQYEDNAAPDVNTPVTFHWAFIRGHNDSIEGVKNIAKMLRERKFRAKFNLVRFNAHPNLEMQGIVEPEEPKLIELFNIISDALGHDRSYMVPRVGKDVAASCGMFIEQ